MQCIHLKHVGTVIVRILDDDRLVSRHGIRYRVLFGIQYRLRNLNFELIRIPWSREANERVGRVLESTLVFVQHNGEIVSLRSAYFFDIK